MPQQRKKLPRPNRKGSARRRRPPLRHLEYQGDLPRSLPCAADPIDGLNALIGHIGSAIRKQKRKLAAEAPVHRQREQAKAWSDARFYTVLVFDTGNQCQAFIDAIRAEPHVSLEGDLFLDGRQIADAFGIALPEPEYELKPRMAGAANRKRAAR